MNKREKTMAGLTAAMAGIFLGFLTINGFVLKPLQKMDVDAQKLSGQLASLQRENAARKSLEPRLKELVSRCFGGDELKAGEELRARLVTLMDQAGLSTEKRLLNPVTGQSVSGAYKEIGRRVQVSGKLGNAVDFLYLLNAEPHLHRLDSLSLTPAQGGTVELNLTYSTLVPAEGLPASKDIKPLPTQPAPNLREGERTLYDPIASRDLLRPYIKRPPPPPPVPQPVPAVARRHDPPPPPPPPPKTSSEGRYRLVLMPMAPGEPFSVLDQSTRQTYSYNIGQFLGGGKVVMVDFRPCPLPDDPDTISPSRLILQIGDAYWAVEYGQTLSAKRQLRKDELPPELSGAAAAPASQPASPAS
ncbi:MAG: hypothetical protein BWX88_01806 [Planctomycetes bacterium ADurb.Bin126]|mgnify:CR=1 FL=1|nr:MAG: hypothetical protein BWX88_01806 [Planctomycetes bacterium ADurb.Bin126]HOD82650.1 hypothetical protein [Phycisphaerae bacterium]